MNLGAQKMIPMELHRTRFYPYKLNPYRLTETTKRSKRDYIDILEHPDNWGSSFQLSNMMMKRDVEIIKLKHEIRVAKQVHLIETSQKQLRTALHELQGINNILETSSREKSSVKVDNAQNVEGNNIKAAKISAALCTVTPLSLTKSEGSSKKKRESGWIANSDRDRTEKSVSKTKKKLCRFYQSQNCQKGDSCEYKHEKLCFFYNNSTCKHGESCRYMHNEIHCEYGNLCTVRFCPFKHDVRRKTRGKQKTVGMAAETKERCRRSVVKF